MAAKLPEAGKWSGREDLNLRPHRPERCALPGCATPRRSPKYRPPPPAPFVVSRSGVPGRPCRTTHPATATNPSSPHLTSLPSPLSPSSPRHTGVKPALSLPNAAGTRQQPARNPPRRRRPSIPIIPTDPAPFAIPTFLSPHPPPNPLPDSAANSIRSRLPSPAGNRSIHQPMRLSPVQLHRRRIPSRRRRKVNRDSRPYCRRPLGPSAAFT